MSPAAGAQHLLCFFVSCAVQEKQQLEKETGLKIVEAGVSDVSCHFGRKENTLSFYSGAETVCVLAKRAGTSALRSVHVGSAAAPAAPAQLCSQSQSPHAAATAS